VVRRGRPPGEPTAVRSVRLPVALWERLEKEAAENKTTINGLIRRKVG
jgi:predicted DNA-binding ribbon-helix-helix protein